MKCIIVGIQSHQGFAQQPAAVTGVVARHFDWQIESQDGAFPLVLSPSSPQTPAEVSMWASENRNALLELSLRYGAVLLRDFPLKTSKSFAELAISLNLTSGNLEGSAAPRSVVEGSSGVVFTSNESPPDRSIPFHHEMAQTPKPPAYVLFYCENPATLGGATPIVLSHEVANTHIVMWNSIPVAQTLTSFSTRWRVTQSKNIQLW